MKVKKIKYTLFGALGSHFGSNDPYYQHDSPNLSIQKGGLSIAFRHFNGEVGYLGIRDFNNYESIAKGGYIKSELDLFNINFGMGIKWSIKST